MTPHTPFLICRPIRWRWCARFNAAFARRILYMLDFAVSGGPSGAASGKMAIGVGGDEQISTGTTRASTRGATQAAYTVRSVPARSPSCEN